MFAQRCSIGGVKFVWHPLDRITSAVLASNVSELFFLFSFILFVVPSPLFSLKTLKAFSSVNQHKLSCHLAQL